MCLPVGLHTLGTREHGGARPPKAGRHALASLLNYLFTGRPSHWVRVDGTRIG